LNSFEVTRHSPQDPQKKIRNSEAVEPMERFDPVKDARIVVPRASKLTPCAIAEVPRATDVVPRAVIETP